MIREYEHLIIGAGIYGLYAARLLSEKKLTTAVLEYENKPFTRASYINQTRVHNGYHYPRSLSTAIKSIHYFKRFTEDFDFAINRSFQKIYALSSTFSYTSPENFLHFCKNAGIPCKETDSSTWFKKGVVERSFETLEYGFDPLKIRDSLMAKLAEVKTTDMFFNARIDRVEKSADHFKVLLENGDIFHSPHVINATYAGINQINELFGFEKTAVKYEICEIIRCSVNSLFRKYGLTVMDGPFFSLMPFGLTEYHCLSAVTFTPHLTSYSSLPLFNCQKINKDCKPHQLQNCNTCIARPYTAWKMMQTLASKFLIQEIELQYHDSLFAIKPILKTTELDDGRPTIIRELSAKPGYHCVLSGKINTVYDLEEILK